MSWPAISETGIVHFKDGNISNAGVEVDISQKFSRVFKFLAMDIYEKVNISDFKTGVGFRGIIKMWCDKT